MRCSGCGLQMPLEDNYCRRCGEPAPIIDVPAMSGSARSISTWEGAKPAVARGVALIAAGAVLRFLLGQAGRAIVSRAFAGGEGSALRRLMPMSGGRSADHGADEIQIIWYRRTRR